MVGRANGVVIKQEELTQPGEALTWRTRGIDELELRGVGTVSFIGYHLLGHSASWNHIVHRCLPVIDPRYRCAPQPAVSEADEARSRLPVQVAAEWTSRFAESFTALLPALQRLAIGAPPNQIPPDKSQADIRISGDERTFIAITALDPHGARILGLAYDDPLSGSLDGREYVYKVVGRWHTGAAVIERIGLLPGIRAVEPGAPPGPTALVASVVPAESASDIAKANLDWPVNIAADDSIPEGEPVTYQIGHRQFSSNPTDPFPVPKPPEQADLLYKGSPVFLQASVARQASPGRVLHTDRNDGSGLSAGLWGWWVRGVDLFGRVSQPSSWAMAAVVDTTPPPAPVLIQAEWVQRHLPATTVAVVGRSVEAQRWLQNSSADDGLVASWAFGPDQEKLRPDVNGFQLLVRKPSGAGDLLQYADPWPRPVASFGPMAIRAEGTVTANPSIDPILAISITTVQQLAPSPGAKQTDPVRSICSTNLELDGASSVFVGGTLVIGSSSYWILANGDGLNLKVVVSHDARFAPGVGAAQLHVTAGKLVELTTNLPSLNPGGNLRARSGVLLVSDGTVEQRLQVLRNNGGVFLCRQGLHGSAAVAAGNTATWYPVWSASLDDTDFGPVADEVTPIAHAQVAVRAVRSIQSAGIVSAPSATLTVTAIDLTIPTSPALDAIPFDPSAHCTPMASRADWYGKSRFRLAWTTQTYRQFLVYRALGDEINRLDRIEHDGGGGRAHSFPDTSWPVGVYADVSRCTRVQAELAALDAARALTDTTARAAAVESAYEAMTIDTQMLLARQAYTWPAYVALTTEPISAHEYEDILDGRSRGHWFYRVTSRTEAGAESIPSEPTPPICCPDVVPPSPPLAHMALADELGNGVNLRWLASPDADTHHYEIFAAQHPEAEAELRSMTPVAVHMPTPHIGGKVITFPVPRPPGDWCFWIIAVDASGNRSAPSAMLRGKSLRPLPVPPVWVSAERAPARDPTHIALVWSHPIDQRLACLVERRGVGAALWVTISPWLPRSVYTLIDVPPDIGAGWEYRIRVLDHLGQTAALNPAITLPSLS